MHMYIAARVGLTAGLAVVVVLKGRGGICRVVAIVPRAYVNTSAVVVNLSMHVVDKELAGVMGVLVVTGHLVMTHMAKWRP
jgi:hypothetical protein